MRQRDNTGGVAGRRGRARESGNSIINAAARHHRWVMGVCGGWGETLFLWQYPTDYRHCHTAAADTPPHCRRHTVRLVWWAAGTFIYPWKGGLRAARAGMANKMACEQ